MQCVWLGWQVQEEGIWLMTHSSVTLAFTHAAQLMQQPQPGSPASCTLSTRCMPVVHGNVLQLRS